MLTELHILNFAIIEKQDISFGTGLNVISGETGAGKSIILQALELVLGGKAKPQYIREGSESLEVRALFDLDHIPEEIRAALPELVEGQELLITRTVGQNGKGKVFINGKLGSVSLLNEIVSKLVTICGQGQQMKLLDVNYHTELIDKFGGHEDILIRYREEFKKWQGEKLILEELRRVFNDSEARKEELSDRIKEIKSLSLVDGRRLQLESEIKKIRNSEKIVSAIQNIDQELNSDQGILKTISILTQELERLATLDADFLPAKELLKSATVNISEFESLIKEAVSTNDEEGEDLAVLEEQLAELARLERKYRTNEAGLLAILSESERELSLIGDEFELRKREKELQGLEAKLRKTAHELSELRLKTSTKLSKLVESDLKELNMPAAKLGVVAHSGELSRNGAESVELLIATNKGESLKPLRQIASGGELSRIMLVLKKVLREKSGVNVLIFDEIDTGVSGGVARSVGEKLQELSKHSQVICITHLPQIASLADRHLLVEKSGLKRAISVVRELSKTEKIEEIARMLAGYTVTDASRESAKELISSNLKRT